MEFNFIKLESSNARVIGRDLVLEDKTTSEVFMTSKKHMDKLFKNAGYRNTNVINILEEFAGKIISEVGLTTVNIYKSPSNTEFVVCSPEGMMCFTQIIKYLNENGFSINYMKANEYMEHDQFYISKEGVADRVFYIDLVEETITIMQLDYQDSVLIGITEEGEYNLIDPDTLVTITSLFNDNSDNSYAFNLEQKISVQEYTEVLIALGILKAKKRKKVVISLDDTFDNIEGIIMDYNEKSYLQRRITENIERKKFLDVCRLITSKIYEVPLWRVKDFYINNCNETSDFCQLYV